MWLNCYQTEIGWVGFKTTTTSSRWLLFGFKSENDKSNEKTRGLNKLLLYYYTYTTTTINLECPEKGKEPLMHWATQALWEL